MSHFTDIETQISDVEALRDACGELGLELVENAEARGYFRNQSMHGQYVIRLKGPYDIALNKDSSGFYQITAVIADLKMLKFGQFENASFQMSILEQTIETLLGFLYLKCPFRAQC